MQKGSKVCVNLHEHWKSYDYSTFDAIIIDVLEGGWYRLKVKNHDMICQVPFYRLSPRRPKETKTHWEVGQEVQVYEPDNQGWWDATIVRYHKFGRIPQNSINSAKFDYGVVLSGNSSIFHLLH